MDHEKLASFRRMLLRHRDNLLDLLHQDPYACKCCLGKGEHDEAPTENEIQILADIEAALGRIDRGAFGKCELCDGEVELDRLELDFTTKVCLDHYSEQQLKELQDDLNLAAKVQRGLLPSATPCLPGLDIAALAEPAKIVGGDYYDFFLTRQGYQGMVLADVMGKGLPASMLMSNLQASLRILGPEYADLSELVTRLNELFRYNLKLLRFITFFVLSYDEKTRTMNYCSAGHEPPLHWKASSGSIDWLPPTGPAIGIIPEAEYQSATVQLRPNDALLLYTDGLVEARTPEGALFGRERLTPILASVAHGSAQEILNEVRHSVRSFASVLEDDLTLMAIKIAS